MQTSKPLPSGQGSAKPTALGQISALPVFVSTVSVGHSRASRT